jgi:hypothetical protein
MFQGKRNTPDGSGEGVVNGDLYMDQYINASSLSLEGIKAILIASDGFKPPHMSERDPADRKALLDMACTDGVQALLTYIRTAEDADQDWQYVRYSHADDATGVLIQRA